MCNYDITLWYNLSTEVLTYQNKFSKTFQMFSRNNAFRCIYWEQDGPIFVFISRESIKTTFYLFWNFTNIMGHNKSSVLSWTFTRTALSKYPSSIQIFKMCLAAPFKIRTYLCMRNGRWEGRQLCCSCVFWWGEGYSFSEIWVLCVSWITYDNLYYAPSLACWALFGSLVPTLCNRTSCAQVPELP